MDVFVVEPENGDVRVLVVFSNVDLHDSVWSLPEPQSFFHDYLLIAHLVFLLLLLLLELLLVVVDNFVLLTQLFWHRLNRKYLLFYPRVHLTRDRVKVLECTELAVRHQTC